MKLPPLLFLLFTLTAFSADIDGLKVGMPMNAALSELENRGFKNITKLNENSLKIASSSRETSVSYNLIREGEIVGVISKGMEGDFKRFVEIIDHYQKTYGEASGVGVMKTPPTADLDYTALRVFWTQTDAVMEASFSGSWITLTIWPKQRKSNNPH